VEGADMPEYSFTHLLYVIVVLILIVVAVKVLLGVL
jgi:hypothetical protein